MSEMLPKTEHYEAWKKLYSDPQGIKATWHLINCRFIEGYVIQFSGAGLGEVYLVDGDNSTKIFLANDTTSWEASNLLQMIQVPLNKPMIKLLNVRRDCQVFIRLRFLGDWKPDGVSSKRSGDEQQ